MAYFFFFAFFLGSDYFIVSDPDVMTKYKYILIFAFLRYGVLVNTFSRNNGSNT